MLNFTLTVRSQEWKLTKNEDGIKVYTAKTASSDFKSIKVEATFPGTIQKLLAVLRDVKNNNKWVYHTKDSYLIERVTENDLLYYAETYLPWPMSNRDMVIRMRFIIDTVTNALKVIAVGEPDAMPPKKGIVRIKSFNATWDIQSIGKNQLVIQYILNVNPGGNISPGISNIFVSKGPFQTFQNLSALLQK